MASALSTVRQAIKSGKGGEITLCRTSPEMVFEANFYALRYASKREMPIIYALFKHPFRKMEDALNQIDVYEPENAFIDGITRAVEGGEGGENDDVIYLSTPQDLTNLGTAVSVSGEKLEDRSKLLVIDSLSSILTYNSVRDVDSFLEDLRDRINTLEIHALVFHESAEKGRLDSSIMQHIDDYVVLEEEEVGKARVKEEKEDYTVIHVPSEAAESAGWEEGDELSVDIPESRSVLLRK